MAIRRYLLQTKQRQSHQMTGYHSGTLDECSGYMGNIVQSGGYDLYDWIRVVEQVYNKHTETWVDTKVVKFKEFN